MYLVTADEMRRMDRATIETFGIPGRVLMENAGRGATAYFLETLYRHQPGRVAIAAGRGNNGGDGFVMARYLHQKGIPVTVFLFTHRDRIQGDAATNLALIDSMGVPVVEVADTAALDARKQDLAHMDLWIDAILGTGLTSDVRGLFLPVIEFINQQKRPVFAVDIPSGLNADSGQVCGICIQAAATATFGFAKVGHFVYPGRSHTGRLKVIEIGIPPQMAVQVGCKQHLITPADLKPALPMRPTTAHKGNSGHLLVLAGSPGKTGAAAMTAMTAMRSGAGLVTLGIPQSLNPVLETMVTEAMTVGLAETSLGHVDESAYEKIVDLLTDKRCLAVGPGLGTNPSTGRLLNRLIAEARIPLVVDADGLNLIADDISILSRKRAPMVLTPHPGEMARLCGQSTAAIQSDRGVQARRFAEQHGVYLVLKGAATIIAQPDGLVFVNPTGNPGMAAGGMGDVLTGLIAGLITQGMPINAAVRAGVYLHGAAADRLARSQGAPGYLATEVMNAVPATIAELLGSGDPPIYPELDPLCYRTAPPTGA
ncbi:Bifunctional NAD(P)H-hydrate repair enzyme Nnr (Includes: ADP-dependent (S)-NAD(P)H-hydrate dehydratase; NAD(P)H-hydrate epimerase) [Desulfosarcina cetonica]|uniref:bifunctional ADP-dependent NAD(P)H-hydrate dehydratase/NAD(P)H-hydrate epimerase n=1 Tax=Desulfosarcina cetonica TaxID=90730 RepID=UPI0006D0861F|nr:bifunctional ADP-dependent NAD(P)H-hydrate dehydratase/NAD(P)H-hydrate epimerase [Desulfosarcina cetonica]VTR65385.1 Bifunctional NAD(P)H-hydrate repair enzyme Nnr (Includes: ADP-dependent (S)-NAD(P)H-hydrate dehydratase; NAD(P)H-hydrate epimerase) [Desulfosarcina cetonica]